MDHDISEVKNWMHMFRWIVKLIRDEYGVGEDKLTRTADIENDIGLSIEQREEVLDTIAKCFDVSFPDGTLDELVRFEEMCLLAAWLHGLYKRPEFLGDDYVASARAGNPRAQE
jgi:hypothetical protein